MAAATRLFVTESLTPGQDLVLERDQSHYLMRVLRLEEGDTISLFNGMDGEWQTVITVAQKAAVTLRLVRQTREQVTQPGPWLAFAPVKKTQTDFIVQKATELGVGRLIPVITERTQSERVRTDRLRATAIEAAEQSERLDVPDISEPVSLLKLLDSWPEDRLLLVCAEGGEAVPLAELAASHANSGAGFVTGPEGGYSAAELDFIHKHSLVQTVGLGPRILRAETAALAALAVWQAVAGDGKTRPPLRG